MNNASEKFFFSSWTTIVNLWRARPGDDFSRLVFFGKCPSPRGSLLWGGVLLFLQHYFTPGGRKTKRRVPAHEQSDHTDKLRRKGGGQHTWGCLVLRTVPVFPCQAPACCWFILSMAYIYMSVQSGGNANHPGGGISRKKRRPRGGLHKCGRTSKKLCFQAGKKGGGWGGGTQYPGGNSSGTTVYLLKAF